MKFVCDKESDCHSKCFFECDSLNATYASLIKCPFGYKECCFKVAVLKDNKIAAQIAADAT